MVSRLFGFLRSRPPEESPLAAALRDYGFARCSGSSGQFNVGLGPDGAALAPVSTLPEGITELRFLAAPDQAELVAALLRDPLAQRLRRLVLGTTQDYTDPRGIEIDLSPALRALALGSLPALTSLSLGDMEQRFGGRRDFGLVGDPAQAARACPGLVELELFGTIEMSAPLVLPQLSALTLEADGGGVTTRPLSQGALDTLLSSELPRLSSLRLSLGQAGQGLGYSLPEVFLRGQSMPNLVDVGIEGLSAEAAARLEAMQAAIRAGRLGA